MNTAELLRASVPIMGCEEARALEARLFAGDESREWPAMQRAGAAIAAGVAEDFDEIGGLPAAARVLVLVGKGHNGGDALIAAGALLRRCARGSVEVCFAFGVRALRPLAARAWRDLSGGELRDRVRPVAAPAIAAGYDVCLDGVFGFQFRPPVDAATQQLLERVNALPIRLRAAVDLPSANQFHADFTYATGVVKTPVVGAAGAGRIRYLDLGFFPDPAPGERRVLTPQVLAPLAALRPAAGDKRTYGHVFVLGGSRSYPGAVLMATLAAVHSGAGLVTAFVPESLVPAYAARLPEAMWVGWPETPAGGLALEGLHLWRERAGRATAALVGPGLAREPETLALARELVAHPEIPIVLDADALQPDIVAAAKGPLVVTPHAGEYERIAGGAVLDAFARERGIAVVLKGSPTRVASGTADAVRSPGGPTVVYHSFFGGPVLARGGSGDLLGGIVATLLAQSPAQPETAAARGVVWHGMAADRLARTRGQVAVATTELLDHLGPVLREL
jgi:NAD(P)H-hydrate epimerase